MMIVIIHSSVFRFLIIHILFVAFIPPLKGAELSAPSVFEISVLFTQEKFIDQLPCTVICRVDTRIASEGATCRR